MTSPLTTLMKRRREERLTRLYRSLLTHEARIGGELFGPVPAQHRREFFCLDEHTWIWHEEWTDASGQSHAKTTRYDVRPDAILKAQDGLNYQPVSDEEALNLASAAEQYMARVQSELYTIDL